MQDLQDTANDRAWRTFFGVYGPLVWAMARHAGVEANGCDEILSNVMHSFCGAVRRGFRVDHDVGLFRNYLRRITNREILGYRNRQANRGLPLGSITESAYALAPDEYWVDVERAQRWQVCLDRIRRSSAISPRDVHVFEEVVLQGMPVKRVADRYGLTVNRVYGIKHTLIRRLREIRHTLDAELGEV